MQRLPLPVLITPLGELELMNAVQLRLFRKEVRSAEARAALAAFRADLRSRVFAIRSLPEGVFTGAAQLASRGTSRLGTRRLDIIHVADAAALPEMRMLERFGDRQDRRMRHAMLLKTR